jgi:predicted nucleic acid-binding protein
MRFVLNASVVVKWLLTDEPLVPEARQIEQAFRDGQIEELLIPELCLREVANALWVAFHRQRIDETTAKELWQFFQSLLQQVLTVLPDPPLDAVLEFALRYGVPVYDSIYLVLAQDEQCPLLTADEHLWQAVAGQLPFVRWLGSDEPQ